MTRTVLVTGGAGYVGSHCCRAFAGAGWKVVVFDNLSRGWEDFVRWGPLIRGDLLDPAAIASAIASVKPDVVAHFAALAYVGESVADPAAYYQNNVAGTVNLLEGMRAGGAARLLFSSTCATYGNPLGVPIDENHPQNPINPYGRSKLMVERVIRDFTRAYGGTHAILRYFNAAGADASGEIGERHEPETHVIPLAIAAAVTGGGFRIFGSEFDTRDGTAIRDYVHVTDLADAHLRAIEYAMSGGPSEAFNLGTGVGTTVSEIADAVERIAGRRLTRSFVGRREGDPPILVASATKALSVLGWRPIHSDIDNIVRTAWRWHQRSGIPAPEATLSS